MKRLTLILFLLVASFSAMAQSGRVTVEMDSDAQSAVNSRRTDDKVWGYTVCLFADNGQNARVSARNNHNKIKDLMPSEFSEVTYENPFFKVYVGRCLNRTEAVRLLGLLKGEFPRAVISVKEFDVAIFGEERVIPDSLMVIDTLRLEL